MTTNISVGAPVIETETELPCDSYTYESGMPMPTEQEIEKAKTILAAAGLATKQKVARKTSELHLYGGVVALVHQLCRENPSLRRCELVRLCESKGIATNTAKTQIQKFLKAAKSVEATEASDQ